MSIDLSPLMVAVTKNHDCSDTVLMISKKTSDAIALNDIPNYLPDEDKADRVRQITSGTLNLFMGRSVIQDNNLPLGRVVVASSITEINLF